MKGKKWAALLLVAAMLPQLGIATAQATGVNYIPIQEKEWGDTYERANPIALQSFIEGHIDAVPTDVDFYALPIPEKTNLSIRISVLTPGVTTLLRAELCNQNLDVIAKAETGYEGEFYGLLVLDKEIEEGHYYLKISAVSDLAVVNEPYQITVDQDLAVYAEGLAQVPLQEMASGPVTQEDIIESTLQKRPELRENYEWFQEWAQKTGSDTSVINDPMAPFQYHLPQVNVYDAWKETMGDPEIIVAVIDQGIDPSIFDLSTRLLPVHHVYGEEEYGAVPVDHGNHVAGLIGARANNGVGVAGIAPNVTVMPINAWDSTAHNRTYESTAQAIRYAADHGARVLSMSIGSLDDGSGDSEVLHDAIRYAYEKGVVMVACTQNRGAELPDYPARYPEVIGVGAIDGNNDLWVGSNRGGDIVAPGYNIVSLGTGGQYLNLSGTSMSTPIVAGAAALVLSKNPTLTCDQVRDILLASAADLGEPETFGHGALDIGKALEMTPEVENRSKADPLKGKWYEDAVRMAVDQGFLRGVSLEEESLCSPISKDEWMEFAAGFLAIPVDYGDIGPSWTSQGLEDNVARKDAFSMLAEGYAYVYGKQDKTGIDLLRDRRIVDGGNDGDLALDSPLTYAGAAQLLYRFRQCSWGY